MPERLFLFLQFEFPWALGPADGRYLLRTDADGEPDRVVVLGTLGAARRGGSGAGGWPILRRSARRRRPAAPSPEPAPVTTTRATIVDPVPLAAERQARAWLAGLDAEHEVQRAVAVLNRVLHFHRIASADPYIGELSAAQALVIRAGWGEGEQVADGRWLHARELPPAAAAPGRARRRRRDRSAALRPQERLAELLSARGRTLLCEELTLRARLDLDQGRVPLAAIELDGAYAAGLRELPAERREDLALRIAELEHLRPAVGAQARAALSTLGADDGAGPSQTPGGPAARTGGAPPSERSAADLEADAAELDEQVLRHALERLEATLRARTATGF